MDDKFNSEIAEECDFERKFAEMNLLEDPECSKNEENKSMEEIDSKPWAELPHLVLTEIFSFLGRNDGLNASAACRHWRSNYFQPRLWRSLKIWFTPDKLDGARFLSDFGEIVIKTDVMLDTSSKECLEECMKFLQSLAVNKKLRTLAIVSVVPESKTSIDRLKVQKSTRYRMNKLIIQLIECLSSLHAFRLTCEPNLFPYVYRLLRSLNPSVKRINLSYPTKKHRLGEKFNPALLLCFKELEILEIDWTQLSHHLVMILFEAKSFKELFINAYCHWEACSWFLAQIDELRKRKFHIILNSDFAPYN